MADIACPCCVMTASVEKAGPSARDAFVLGVVEGLSYAARGSVDDVGLCGECRLLLNRVATRMADLMRAKKRETASS